MGWIHFEESINNLKVWILQVQETFWTFLSFFSIVFQLYFAYRVKDGEDVKADGKHITISEDGQLHSLVITNVNRSDSGIYAAQVRLWRK